MAGSHDSSTTSIDVKTRVLRVRNLPAHVNELAAVELLSQSIHGFTTQDIKLYSLAYDVDIWPRLMTKTATITLQVQPPELSSILRDGECTIKIPGLPSAKPLIIDHHFQGVTPLNHVADHKHKFDCLIISGLSSHPFGSWQAHGTDKSFMWIRDDLPERLPGVRFLTYGYDTSLRGSTSFQRIQDLAISLVQTMKFFGWSTPSAKPILFLAHSLGGVVLKQALVILAGAGNREMSILGKIKGAIFFGVPSQGMNIPDIIEMVRDQSNVALVDELSEQSEYLPRLDEQFGNISWLQRIQFFWAFETKCTPSVEKTITTGRFTRTGPGTVMVSRESATRNLCHTEPSCTLQVDENHSDMVKFGLGDKYIGIIARALEHICTLSEAPVSQLEPHMIRNLSRGELVNLPATSNQPKNIGETQAQRRPNFQPEWTIPGFWDDDRIVQSLRAPERDRRLEQINQKLGDTFNWAYDDSSVGLSEWLRKGTGIFWIHGKPGSGKSTLMKYLYQDSRTEELLRVGSWQSGRRLAKASFFFHHRGNNMQKSFEGLLRSLASQILEREKSLAPLLYTMLSDQYRTRVTSAGLGNLEEDIWTLLNYLRISESSESTKSVEDIVVSQTTMTRDLGTDLRRMLKGLGFELNSLCEETFDGNTYDDPEFKAITAISLQLFQLKVDPSQSFDQRTWEEKLSRVLQRHYQRQKIKNDIQWTRTSLEECLRLLVGQSSVKMDLFLFVDALDEYDGRPEFIASFLQGLVRQGSGSSKQTSTVVRILFSSRPWRALEEEFAACPGLQIHDHTANDILELCVANIPSEDIAKTFLSPLTREVVRRARGVFLWVELVMRDLAKLVLDKPQLQDEQELEWELRKTLDAIPDELDDYYQLIIQRIPLGNRWESYVVLETLCRSDEDIDVETLLAILICASSKSVADARRKLKDDSKLSLDTPGLEQGERYIRVVAGGLVEVGSVSYDGQPVMQFMHQTVKQFVEKPWFRSQLLGHNVGMFVTENGHSFIAKHLFALASLTDPFVSPLTDRFVHHARQAEVTMGFSQYEFFSTAPPNYLSCVRNGQVARLSSITVVSVYSGLQLCVRDAWEADPCCIQRDSTKLISVLFGEAKVLEFENGMDRIIDMTKFLVTKGLSIDQPNESLLDIVKSMWGKDSRRNLLFENLAIVLLDTIQFARSATREPSPQTNSKQVPTILSSRAVTELFHQATPDLARVLLAHGFSPNTMDTSGNTPIDFLIKLSARLSLSQKHDIVSQLASKGGLLNLTRRSRWDEFERRCVGSGLDTTVFRQAGLPLWCSNGKPARKHRSLAVILSQRIQS